MKVSVCTVTARSGFVDQQARMLANQTHTDIEWVLVDFDFDNRCSEVADLCSSLKLSLVHVPNVRDGVFFIRDIPRNRNLALQKASGDVVLFLDDYACVDSCWVYRHLISCNDGYLSCGKMFNLISEGLSDVFTNDFVSKGLSAVKNTYYIEDDHRDTGKGVVRNCCAEWSYTGNLGIPRKVFEKLNGFDPRLTIGIEDGDFGLRAKIAGFTVAYNPSAYSINLPAYNIPYVNRCSHMDYFDPGLRQLSSKVRGFDATLVHDTVDVTKFKIFEKNDFILVQCLVCGATAIMNPLDIIDYNIFHENYVVSSELPGAYS